MSAEHNKIHCSSFSYTDNIVKSENYKHHFNRCDNFTQLLICLILGIVFGLCFEKIVKWLL